MVNRRCLGLMLIIVAGLGSASARADEEEKPDSVGPNRRDEPKAAYSRARAAQFIDAAALGWHKDNGCFSCHSNLSFLYARPALSAQAPAHATVRKQLEELVTQRWPDKGLRWDMEPVVAAAALAYNDAATTGKLHPTTRVALERMWTVQGKDGGWNWYKCGWPPMELDDHYGATLAAVAVGVAPDGYAQTDAAKAGMAKLRAYLRAQPPKHVHHRAMLLWAASYTDDLITAEQRKDYVKELLTLQRPDGGWSAASLGDYKRGDKKAQEPEISDGYGTGFVIFVLRRAGVPANDPALERGIAWLKANQRESGRWFTRSLFRDNRHYLTHAGTAFAVMALGACEAQ